ACTSSAVALLGPCSTSRPSSSAISAESPNAKAITSGPSWPLSAAYDAHIASTAAWSAGAMSTNAILGSAAEANPDQGPPETSAHGAYRGLGWLVVWLVSGGTGSGD